MSSLGSLFTKWFGPPGAAVTADATGSPAAGTHRDQAYPPVDSGLPAVSTEEVIAPHAELLKRMRDAYGADPSAFERDIASVVARYAQFVHLLPATADAYFRGAGGLFRMGLEVAFFALQATDGAIFSGRQTITQRLTLEPRWRYATFLAGLCGGLHCVFTDFVVTNERGREWPAYVLPLALWLRQENANRYYIRWRPRPPQAHALGVVAMTHIVTTRTLQSLAEGNVIVIPSLVASVSATASREANMLDQLVRRASALVIERDLHGNADRYGKPQLGSHLERYLVDAMRRLVAQGKWLPNAESSPLWYAEDGMFLLWPQAAADMLALLEQDRLPGVPRAHQTIAELLAAAGVIEAGPDGSSLWDIFVPDAKQSSPALKLASPLLLASAARESLTALPRPLRQPAAAAHPMRPAPPAELPLSIPGPRPVASAADPPAPQAGLAPRAPLSLNAPARLNPTVRDALQQIIATIGSSSPPLAGLVIELGVFVPLKEFERRSVDPALAVRALSEAGMLASDPQHPGSKTLSQDFHDEPVLGLVVASRCVAGLGPAEGLEPARPASH